MDEHNDGATTFAHAADEMRCAIAAIARREQRCADRERVAANLPVSDADLAALLDELAAADIDREEHYKRHPAVREITLADSPYDRAADPAACKADWHRVCDRLESARGRLTRFARARRLALEHAAIAASVHGGGDVAAE